MNELQVKITERARIWAECWCCETRTNGGNCVDDLTTRFTGKSPWRAAYCAMTAFVLYQEACSELGMRLLLPKTAGARALLEQSKKHPVLRDYISSEPIPGAQFYRASSVQGARTGSEITGHIGTVYQITDKRMIAVEGNASQQIRYVSYSLDDVYNPKRGFAFIHACLAPHPTDMRLVYVTPGMPVLLPWKQKAELPVSCRKERRCKPKAT